MRPCNEHLQAMRGELSALGLAHLLVKEGEPYERLLIEFHDAATLGLTRPAHFDPLLAMLWAICGKVVRHIGPVLFFPVSDADQHRFAANLDPQGRAHYCPLCLVREDFVKHLTGLCTNPECKLAVKEGDEAWDREWIRSSGAYIFGQAMKKGMHQPPKI